VLAMKAIWTEHEASFSGDFVSFSGVWSDPKPVQRPHPPVLVGGNGPTVLDRVLEYGDAWMPNYFPGVLDRIAELRERAERPIEVVVMGAPADVEQLREIEAAGADRALFWLPSGGRAVVEAALAEWEQAVFALHDRPL
jgi:alkanesulfonate monooxygenase SsuD/methylene tetrahydromethanopterin reductase-like flavin-dependent oxidoreductase (luciferase family)